MMKLEGHEMSRFYTNVSKYKNNILVIGYENGKRFRQKVSYKPSLFIPAKPGSNSKYRTIDGKRLDKITFDTIGKQHAFMKQYADVDGFQTYGFEHTAYSYIYDFYKDQETPDTSKLRVCVLDIEVSMENGMPNLETSDSEITAITMMYPNQNITFVFGYGEFKTDDPKIKYFRCKDEEDLLTKFLKLWSSDVFYPDVLTGWNVEHFDMPYIVNRLQYVLDPDAASLLSPWGQLEQRQISYRGQDKNVYFPMGVSILDYIIMYKKFVGVVEQQESYALDHIAQYELGERKLDYSNYGSLHKLYVSNHQKFIEYNIRDCELVHRIDQRRRLLDLVYFVAYGTGTNYIDSLKTVRSWDTAITNFLMDKNIVVPKIEKTIGRKPVGGFVKDPLRGMHDWVVSFDLTSLYPHLIMQYNIGPDTYRKTISKKFSAEELMNGEHHEYHDMLDENNLCMAANSICYTKEHESFLAVMMRELFDTRKEYKNKMLELKQQKEKITDENEKKRIESEIAHLDTLQYAIKVRLNSAYGALANQWFRWYDIRYAESITMSGQLTIKWAERKLNEFMNKWCKTEGVDYVCTVDTDSVYLDMSKIVELMGHDNPSKALDAFCEKKVQPYLDKVFEQLCDSMRGYKQSMHMKREAISDRGVFLKKKRYMLNVLNNEGVQYSEPQLKIMGVESVRTSTPQIVRDALKESIRIVLQEQEKDLQDYIKAFRARFNEAHVTEICAHSSVKNLNNYQNDQTIYGAKTPIYYRGALLYNHYLKQLDLTKKYELIDQGHKIKYVYLKLPNPLDENVISFLGNGLPEEMDLDRYIDRDLQFEKSYLEPLRNILDAIRWEEEPINTLRGFFS